MKNILLSGYYGYRNIGDEAVLGGILAGLRRLLPDVSPVVLSGDPAGTQTLHDVRTTPRMALKEIRARLQEADLFISGGGSLLQDVTSIKSPLYYLGLLGLAQRAQVPTMILAQGMGPLRHPLNRWLARRILNGTQAITVRDAGSADFLDELGVTVPPIEVTADPSFMLEAESSARLEEWWQGHIPAGRPVLGVALRPWHVGAGRYTAIADALVAVAERTGAFLLFIPMQFDQDLPLAEEMAGWTPAEGRVLKLPLTPREMLALVGRCDLILAMRLHTLIFAVQQAVPSFGISYDPKVIDFALEADLPLPMDWGKVSADTLTEALLAQWEQRADVKPQLSTRAAALRTLAERNILRIAEVLGIEPTQ